MQTLTEPGRISALPLGQHLWLPSLHAGMMGIPSSTATTAGPRLKLAIFPLVDLVPSG